MLHLNFRPKLQVPDSEETVVHQVSKFSILTYTAPILQKGTKKINQFLEFATAKTSWDNISLAGP